MAICCFKKCKPKICCLRCIPTQKKLLCKKEKAKTLLSCKTKTRELFQKKEKRHDVTLSSSCLIASTTNYDHTLLPMLTVKHKSSC